MNVRVAGSGCAGSTGKVASEQDTGGVYVVTLAGNISIITLIRSCSQLHTPMYLFLSHLAFVDIGYSTSVTPVMLIGFLGRGVALPLAGCEAQLCSVVMFGTAECFLLAAMAYDRYVAICLPLLYSTHMSPRREDRMTRGNRTTVTEFVLMGFTDRPELQLPLFVVFLVIYLITLLGNLGMILLIKII
ncbi:Olfactory Receptor 5P3 [Manis pentadactyla]|nr:Olfactory Receptor 5P3 [Manis pentadactyla]